LARYNSSVKQHFECFVLAAVVDIAGEVVVVADVVDTAAVEVGDTAAGEVGDTAVAAGEVGDTVDAADEVVAAFAGTSAVVEMLGLVDSVLLFDQWVLCLNLITFLAPRDWIDLHTFVGFDAFSNKLFYYFENDKKSININT
jgi:hypothetical protein